MASPLASSTGRAPCRADRHRGHGFRAGAVQDFFLTSRLAGLYRRNRAALGPRLSEPDGAERRIVGSTDFGTVSHQVRALHPLFDIGAPTPNHHPDFTAAAATPLAEQAMLDAALTMSWTLIDAATEGFAGHPPPVAGH